MLTIKMEKFWVMDRDNSIKKETNYLVSSWKGHEPLWKAYWFNFVFGLFVLDKLANWILANGNFPLMIGYLILFITYFSWSVVSVWKCAPNTSIVLWKYLARAVVIIGPITGVLLELT